MESSLSEGQGETQRLVTGRRWEHRADETWAVASLGVKGVYGGGAGDSACELACVLLKGHSYFRKL